MSLVESVRKNSLWGKWIFVCKDFWKSSPWKSKLWYVSRPQDSAPDSLTSGIQERRELLFRNFKFLAKEILDFSENREDLLLRKGALERFKAQDQQKKQDEWLPGVGWLRSDSVVVSPPFMKSDPDGAIFAQYHWKIVGFTHNLLLQLMFVNHHIPDSESYQWSCGGHPA